MNLVLRFNCYNCRISTEQSDIIQDMQIESGPIATGIKGSRKHCDLVGEPAFCQVFSSTWAGMQNCWQKFEDFEAVTKILRLRQRRTVTMLTTQCQLCFSYTCDACDMTCGLNAMQRLALGLQCWVRQSQSYLAAR